MGMRSQAGSPPPGKPASARCKTGRAVRFCPGNGVEAGRRALRLWPEVSRETRCSPVHLASISGGSPAQTDGVRTQFPCDAFLESWWAAWPDSRNGSGMSRGGLPCHGVVALRQRVRQAIRPTTEVDACCPDMALATRRSRPAHPCVSRETELRAFGVHRVQSHTSARQGVRTSKGPRAPC